MENKKITQLIEAKRQCEQLLWHACDKLQTVRRLAYAHNFEDEVQICINKTMHMAEQLRDEQSELQYQLDATKRERVGRWMDGICAELEMRLEQLCFDDLCTVSNDTSGNDAVPSRSLIIESGNADESRTVYQGFVPNALYDDYPNEEFSTFSVVVITWEGDMQNCEAVYRDIGEVIDFIHADMEQRGLNP